MKKQPALGLTVPTRTLRDPTMVQKQPEDAEIVVVAA
jgi:hypothetical protein